jgi:hypothetical protein
MFREGKTPRLTPSPQAVKQGAMFLDAPDTGAPITAATMPRVQTMPHDRYCGGGAEDGGHKAREDGAEGHETARSGR